MSVARIVAIALVVLALAVLALLPSIRRGAVVLLSDDYQDEGEAAIAAVFEGPDRARQQLDVMLSAKVEGLDQPTELAFVPGQPDLLVVLQKPGQALWVAADGSARGTLLEVSVVTRSEEGLLGLGHGAPSIRPDVSDQQHVGAVDVEFEPLPDRLAQHRWREGAEALAVLDL